MFSGPLLRYKLAGGRLEPCYLDERYAPLIRDLLLAYESAAGQPYHRLEERLGLFPAFNLQERRLFRGLRKVIEESLCLQYSGKVAPRRIRETVFRLAGENPGLPAEEIFTLAAAALGLGSGEVCDQLYGDLARNRRVEIPSPLPSPGEVVSRYNFRLLQGLLGRCVRLQVSTEGNARAIYQLAKLHGLLLELREASAAPAAPLRLEITGPLALFRSTLRYGRALARFLPACCAGTSYRIQAVLRLKDRQAVLEVTPQDRLLSSHRLPRLFDSRVEKRFFEDFLRLGSPWSILREADLLPAGRTVFIPDFTLRHRERPDRPVHLEIIGFWTRDYLARKRQLLRQLPPVPLILCIDRSLRLDEAPAEPGGSLLGGSPPGDSPLDRFPVIHFTGRVPAEEALKKVVAMTNFS
ncbi:MAG: DUF790 family protein [Planctomycetes bacterium]|nr:DUF790 family protein [Planctomycetota bacterium]